MRGWTRLDMAVMGWAGRVWARLDWAGLGGGLSDWMDDWLKLTRLIWAGRTGRGWAVMDWVGLGDGLEGWLVDWRTDCLIRWYERGYMAGVRWRTTPHHTLHQRKESETGAAFVDEK